MRGYLIEGKRRNGKTSVTAFAYAAFILRIFLSSRFLAAAFFFLRMTLGFSKCCRFFISERILFYFFI